MHTYWRIEICGIYLPMAIIYQTDSFIEIAKKIWEGFEVGASCTVYGFVRNTLMETLTPKGELVVGELKRLDKIQNLRQVNMKKVQRKNVYRKDSVGGPIAHKIFTWEKRIVENEIRYTIWRFQ